MKHDTFTGPSWGPPAREVALAHERHAWRALAAEDRALAGAYLGYAAVAHATTEDAEGTIPARPMLDQPAPLARPALCAQIARELADPDPYHRAGVLRITPAGWAIQSHRHRSSSSTLSGYGDDWTAHVHHLTPEALIINTRTIPDEGDLVTLAINGPMVDPDTPAGILRGFGEGRPFDARPSFDAKDLRLGNARGLDHISPADYATIARRFGATTYTTAELLASPEIITTSESDALRFGATA